MQTDFAALWRMVVTEADRLGNGQLKATFLNHEDRKEYICRKYGIVSPTDIKRISVGGVRKPR